MKTSPLKIGVIRERKVPPESRVPFTPTQAAFLRKELDINIVFESSPSRCYKDQEYSDLGVPVVDSVGDCSVLMGVKEVPVDQLIPGKTYFFFSHTIKMQEYNKALLAAILRHRITLVDYELLTNTHGHRIIAFGHYAGIVGAHNALWTWAQRSQSFVLPRMRDLTGYAQARELYHSIKIPPVRIVLTGTGRVGTGALQALQDMGIRQVEAHDFLEQNYPYPVFTQLLPHHYLKSKDDDYFDKSAFYNDPEGFESTFFPFCTVSDIMINGIHYVREAPAFFTLEQMRRPDFNLRVIADISCDLAPHSSIPSTIRVTAIDAPVFGYDPFTGQETEPFQKGSIDMMTIDNLPNELPRESSKAFGKQFITKILGELLRGDPSEMLERATITEDGKLKPAFEYLGDWVKDGGR